MRRANLLGGGLLVALGAVSLVEALRIHDEWPGARLLPAVIGACLVVLGAAHLLGVPTAGRPAWPDGASRRRVAVVFGALVCYVAALPFLGFLLATALFVPSLLRVLGTYSWALTLALAGVVAAAGHVVFKHWLGMPLPPGPLGL